MKQNLMWLGLFALLAASAASLRRGGGSPALSARTRRASEALNEALGEGPDIVRVASEATPRQLSEHTTAGRTDDLLSPGPADAERVSR